MLKVDMLLTSIVKNCSNRIEWNSVEITPTFFKNADHMFHKFEIKDDELLPYTDKNDFINGTLFHAWIYFEQSCKSEKHLFIFLRWIFWRKCASHGLKKEHFTYKSKAAKCLRERHDDDCKWDCKSSTHIQMNSYKCVWFSE